MRSGQQRDCGETFWKWRNESRVRGSVPKSTFPMLLNRLVVGMVAKKENLVSGFQACGLWPLDQDQVLKRLPPIVAVTANSLRINFGESVAELLESHVGASAQPKKKCGPKVTPRKPVTLVGFRKEASSSVKSGDVGDESEESDVSDVTEERDEFDEDDDGNSKDITTIQK